MYLGTGELRATGLPMHRLNICLDTAKLRYRKLRIEIPKIDIIGRIYDVWKGRRLCEKYTKIEIILGPRLVSLRSNVPYHG